MSTLFIKDAHEYTRDQNIVREWASSMAYLLAHKHNISLEAANEFIKRRVGKDGDLTLTNPVVTYIGKKNNKDEELRKTSLTEYINSAVVNNQITAPTMTIYENPSVERSMSSMFIKTGIDARDSLKIKKKQAAEENIPHKVTFYQNGQIAKKYDINSISGAHVAQSTPLCKPNIHNALTSMCRVMTSFANANNEKLISGNRHYWHWEIAYAAIAHSVTHTDLDLLSNWMTDNQILPPSEPVVRHMLERSINPYVVNNSKFEELITFVMALPDVERSAFCYVGDMHTLRHQNPDYCKSLFSDLMTVVVGGDAPEDDASDIMTQLNDEQVVYVGRICGDICEQKNPRSIDKMSPKNAATVVETARAFLQKLSEHEQFVTVMFKNDVQPLSQARLPNMFRRAAIAGDTDSTIFTTQNWCQWWDNVEDDVIAFTQDAKRSGFLMMYFASENITHILAQVSRNLGIPDELVFEYRMKSEYLFSVFVTTTRAKTYFADQADCEGLSIPADEIELESKGAVHKASQSPQFVRDKIKWMQTKILTRVKSGKKIKLTEFLNMGYELERQIYDHIKSGGLDYFRTVQIKSPESYKGSEYQSPFFQYHLWNRTFGLKYGTIKEVPYTAVALSLDLPNKTSFMSWVKTLPQEVHEGLFSILNETGKARIENIRVPIDIIKQHGMPDELLNAIDIRGIIASLMEPIYVDLECLGYYAINGNNSGLLIDNYTPTSAVE